MSHSIYEHQYETPMQAMKDNDNNIDSERVYCTNAIIKKVGGAVAVSLCDATLPGNARNKHMTILYRSGPRWTDNEISMISKETDSWIKEKYGSNQAPVTFTINKWGKRSVKIDGDLNDLCIHLRTKFGEITNDKQRIPHCELFVNHRNHRNDNYNNNNTKLCHICGESGHFRKHCPRKQDRKNRKNRDCDTCRICGELGHFKRDCPQKYDRKNGRNKACHICNGLDHLRRDCPQKKAKKNGNYKNSHCSKENKLNQRLERMIGKTQELKQKKQREIDLLDDQEKQLQELLNNAENLDDKTLRERIKSIAKSFKNQKKEINKKHNKKHHHKKDRKELNKKEKELKKQQRKELNKKRKEEKKLQKEERKRLKKLNKNKKGDVVVDDEQKETFEPDTNDEFVKVNTDKMNSMQFEDEDTASTDYSEGDDDDCTPDEVEGDNDYEFTSIFGEHLEF